MLFLALRVALLQARDVFYDELFTAWISAKPFAGIVEALRVDSGPPLYYFLCHLLPWPRVVSLVCASIALAALLRKRHFVAATLLAVFPPAVLFAVDGRAYATCAMFVTIAVLARAERRWWLAAAMVVCAAYAHYYGVLFLPILVPRWRAVGAALVAYAPGFALAMTQPRAATAWLSRIEYPYALLAPPPPWLTIVAALLIVVTIMRKPSRVEWMWMTVVPIGAAIAVTLAGRNVYLPLRFEAVLAPPLVLWLESSLLAWRREVRRVLVFALVACGAAATWVGIVDHLRRLVDPYRQVAAVAKHVAAPGTPVVASGYLYLETEAQLGARVIAFPREQAQHPGWRAAAGEGALARELDALPPQFLWAGERNAPELRVLRRRCAMQPLFANERGVVAKMLLTPALH